eukprot:gene51196-49341_t
MQRRTSFQQKFRAVEAGVAWVSGLDGPPSRLATSAVAAEGRGQLLLSAHTALVSHHLGVCLASATRTGGMVGAVSWNAVSSCAAHPFRALHFAAFARARAPIRARTARVMTRARPRRRAGVACGPVLHGDRFRVVVGAAARAAASLCTAAAELDVRWVRNVIGTVPLAGTAPVTAYCILAAVAVMVTARGVEVAASP